MRGTEGTLAFLKLTQQIDTQLVDSGVEGGLVLIAFPYVRTMTVIDQLLDHLTGTSSTKNRPEINQQSSGSHTALERTDDGK